MVNRVPIIINLVVKDLRSGGLGKGIDWLGVARYQFNTGSGARGSPLPAWCPVLAAKVS